MNVFPFSKNWRYFKKKNFVAWQILKTGIRKRTILKYFCYHQKVTTMIYRFTGIETDSLFVFGCRRPIFNCFSFIIGFQNMLDWCFCFYFDHMLAADHVRVNVLLMFPAMLSLSHFQCFWINVDGIFSQLVQTLRRDRDTRQQSWFFRALEQKYKKILELTFYKFPQVLSVNWARSKGNLMIKYKLFVH